MADTSREKERTKTPSRHGLFRLLWKQTMAAVLCGIFFFLMHSLPVPFLNRCSDALGRALRHEWQFSAEKIPSWIQERIPLP